jgi:DNA-binding transcriptional MerR regulator
MTPKLFKATEVCEMTGLQSYVLRSWEKEFPGIGVQKSADSPRLYRQSDVDQVQRIKQLVFAEGLTLSGARRRIEDERPDAAGAEETEFADVLGADARARIAHVRDGLRSILSMLSGNGDGHAYVGRVPRSQPVRRDADPPQTYVGRVPPSKPVQREAASPQTYVGRVPPSQAAKRGGPAAARSAKTSKRTVATTRGAVSKKSTARRVR